MHIDMYVSAPICTSYDFSLTLFLQFVCFFSYSGLYVLMLFDYYSLYACFSKEKQGVHSHGRGDGKNLRGNEGGEVVLRIYFV